MTLGRRFSWFFAPSILGNALSFVMVPVVTYYLTAQDIGMYALMVPVVTLGGTVALVGSAATCAVSFIDADAIERRKLVSTCIWLGLGVALAFALAVGAGWLGIRAMSPALQEVPTAAVVLTLATIVLGVPFGIAAEVITLEGRAAAFATITMLFNITTVAATVLSLSVFHLGALAQFVGAFAGAAVLCAGAFAALWPHLEFGVSDVWMRRIFTLGPSSVVGNLAEGLQPNIERQLLAGSLGLSALGLYAHSLTYRTVMHTGIKAAARSVWPVALLEARAKPLRFEQTRNVWSLVHLVVAFAGVGAVFVGREIVALLTHGKFTAAYLLIPLWMIYLLVQNTGKGQVALIYAHGAVRQYLWMTVGSYVVGLSVLALLVGPFGLNGAIVAAICQQLALRIGVYVIARPFGTFPLSDQWAGVGAAVILLALAIERATSPGVVAGAGWVVIFGVGLAGAAVWLRRQRRLLLAVTS